MIYIKYNENNEVTYTHYMPFHKEHGLGKTKGELLRDGAIVDEIPTIECPNDKMIVHKYSKENNTVYCELIDRPLTEEEQLQDKISILQGQNANLLLDNAKKEIEINRLNKNLANVTLEIAKIKGGM